MAEILATSVIKVEPSGQEYELKDAEARRNLADMTDDIANFDLEIEAIKKSVSDGKILLADAITQQGVITEADSTLRFMAENISRIRSGGGYSGPYYSNFKIKNYQVPIYNGYPYVYADYYNNKGNENNVAVIADYEWQDSNDWHLISQYYNSQSNTDWLGSLFVMGLYNETTQLGLGISTDGDFNEFYLKCFTTDSPNSSTEYKITADSTTLSTLSKVFFDLHYTYDADAGVGHLTLSYADATQEVLNWVTMFSQYITLSSNSFGKPIYLSGPANLCYYSSCRKTRWLNIGECAFVVDGYIDWGNSTLYPFREGETPY